MQTKALHVLQFVSAMCWHVIAWEMTKKIVHIPFAYLITPVLPTQQIHAQMIA